MLCWRERNHLDWFLDTFKILALPRLAWPTSSADFLISLSRQPIRPKTLMLSGSPHTHCQSLLMATIPFSNPSTLPMMMIVSFRGWGHCGYRSHKHTSVSGGRREFVYQIYAPSTHIWYSSNWMGMVMVMVTHTLHNEHNKLFRLGSSSWEKMNFLCGRF